MAMSADVLRLRNLRFYAYHGLHAAENQLGQRYEVDVEIRRDLGPAGQADDLQLTVDYPRVIALIEEVVTGRRFRLVEALAEAIASRVGRECGPMELLVRVRKPSPPVAVQFDGIEVEICRTYP